MVKSTKCFFGFHNWKPLPSWVEGGNPRRQCTRCKKRQISLQLGYSRKWFHN